MTMLPLLLATRTMDAGRPAAMAARLTACDMGKDPARLMSTRLGCSRASVFLAKFPHWFWRRFVTQ